MAHLKDLIVNGASRFIGKAYGAFVGSFSGNLDGNATTSTIANTAKACSGNAATATKLQTPRTLSLTGKAAGSTTFDGSANAAINVTSVNADTVDGYHASDIINRISAANTGGIVAASLTENGYVKFANGLILQWGNASGDDEGGNSNTTFPIAFPSTCFVVLLTSKSYNNCLLSQSKTGFTWKASSGHISWAALGR